MEELHNDVVDKIAMLSKSYSLDNGQMAELTAFALNMQKAHTPARGLATIRAIGAMLRSWPPHQEPAIFELIDLFIEREEEKVKKNKKRPASFKTSTKNN